MPSAKDLPESAILNVLVSSNPKRIETIAWHQFAFLEKHKGKTVGELRLLAKHAAQDNPGLFRGPNWLTSELNWCLDPKHGFIEFWKSPLPNSTGLSKAGDSKKSANRTVNYYLTLARPDQAQFRAAVMKFYNYTCAVSGCSTEAALEAAHIEPFSQGGADTVENGLLLRADIHRLFDRNLVAIDPQSLEVTFHPACAQDYENYNLSRVNVSPSPHTQAALESRWMNFRTQIV